MYIAEGLRKKCKMDIEAIRKLCSGGTLRWTNHVFMRLIQRGISMDDVESSLMSGEIIEIYPGDYPYPSCLVLGVTADKQYLHVVCGMGDKELWMITAYYPDSGEWTNDFRARKEDI
jgi:hypothetical protein